MNLGKRYSPEANDVKERFFPVGSYSARSLGNLLDSSVLKPQRSVAKRYWTEEEVSHQNDP